MSELNAALARWLPHDPTRRVVGEAQGHWATAADWDAATIIAGLAWRDLGAGKGEIVVLCLPNGLAWLAEFRALRSIGAVVVPLDATTSVADQVRLAEAIGASWLRNADGRARVAAERGNTEPGWAVGKVTSGSTGLPQVHYFSEAQVVADGRALIGGMGIQPDDINLAVVPLGHSYGLGNLVMPLFLQGTALAVADAFMPRAICETAAWSGATIFPAVPALVRVFSRIDPEEGAPWQLRLVISAGGRLEPAVAVAFRERWGLAVHNFYGASETGGIAYDPTGADTASGRSVGWPLPAVDVACGPAGQIVVQGPAVLTGVAELADEGELLPDGALRLTGRQRGFIKRAGRRLSLSEVERAAAALPGVTQVWAEPGQRRGEEVWTLYAETEATREDVAAALAAHLEAWKRPDRIICVAAFPLTARGKLDRALLLKK